ncbi:2-octaprenyl-3-methyl-6-methoxy-1,4-benzoquinol hydroxylase [Marinobacter sp. DSM 26671]|jgi:2-octaprenyl-3-methyl-6-methoxy-1,4-benzoquinol hydroxylase|uniref:Ubiquinone biosynthesis protein UbiH n=2 Tax=Marinobacter TaxID=2742 RepID=A0A3D8H1S5_9GAMM|nr:MULTISPECIES: FAD-dependent monooxygenase [Marinobacter]MCP4064605.1 ubiquinone biosynthesis protein UbiH [Gammaproteobacteria bacterium]HAP52307.1 ubiquinone biosynthesis protein UbiH [Marinobacter adhaerens]AKV96001.1 ubiquinone biosynthesis protein UbiH [Marinobacter sp. CP1]MAK48654.1 ubiquinone biosynthesis protein UbiH [Marinobacter sp.]MAM52762.1 ubiquinone biosynthesis protein UbiH [Marinobacter sp.]|tara:strand:- start:5531 stop:6826 length:1296 start_codon:yes stop_codon:yes gene_type:complete
MTQVFDIVVVGAGMVGAALATGLGQNGFRVALVDRAPPPDFDPESAPDIRVSALSAGSERYLQSLGAWDHILGMRSTPYRRLAVWDETRYPLQNLVPRKLAEVQFDATELGAHHLGHIVENSVTQQALWQTAEACPQISLFHGQGVASLAQSGDTATVTLDDDRELLASLVVGCDGAQSRIRDLAGIGVTRNQYDQQAMVISVRYQGPVEDITWQGFHPSGPRAFLPLHSAGPEHPGESWGSLVWYDSPDELARLKALDDSTLMSEIQSSFPASLPLLTHIDIKASFPIARQHAKQYHSGRVVLAGDSAHTINPLAGQGVNLGFQDAQALQSALKEAKRAGDDLANPKWLNLYEQQRRPANRRMMLTMDLFYHLFSNRIPPVHLLRNLGLGAARALPFARNRVARYAMGIDEKLPAVVRQIASRIPGLNQL